MAPPSPRRRSGVGSQSTGPISSNFRPVEKGRWAAKKGTLPLPEPITIPEMFVKVILHVCRKVLFVDPKFRLLAYAILLFFFSLVSDYLPFPKTYFSDKTNFLNVYFVKFSWAWTFVFTGMFMFLTSATYCCGNRDRIIRHMLRLLIGTIVWFAWTSIFGVIEESTGQCLLKEGVSQPIKTRRTCISKTGKWTSFDISGHSFLLIWCVLFITEEAKAIIGWDGIKDLIRNEEYYRSKVSQQGPGPSGDLPLETSLNSLSDEEFTELKVKYGVFDCPAKIMLMGMTVLSIIWDLMVLMTAIYYHIMIEKVLGGLVATFTWFVIYRGLYKFVEYIGLPGRGLFKYNFTEHKSFSSKTSPQVAAKSSAASNKSKSSTGTRLYAKELDDVPKFMGMPLYPLKNSKKDGNHDSADKRDSVS